MALAEKFPNGIGNLADYMHQRNLKLGLEVKAILMNREAIAVNQDPAVIPAKRIRKDDNTELWSRKLADGSLCVVVLQKTKTNQKVEFTWEEIGLSAGQHASVRDLWQHKTEGEFTKGFSISVNAHGCAMLKITKKLQ